MEFHTGFIGELTDSCKGGKSLWRPLWHLLRTQVFPLILEASSADVSWSWRLPVPPPRRQKLKDSHASLCRSLHIKVSRECIWFTKPRSQICTLTARKLGNWVSGLFPGGSRTNTGEISLNKATVFKKCVGVCVCLQSMTNIHYRKWGWWMPTTTQWSQNSEWWPGTVGSRVRDLLWTVIHLIPSGSLWSTLFEFVRLFGGCWYLLNGVSRLTGLGVRWTVDRDLPSQSHGKLHLHFVQWWWCSQLVLPLPSDILRATPLQVYTSTSVNWQFLTTQVPSISYPLAVWKRDSIGKKNCSYLRISKLTNG